MNLSALIKLKRDCRTVQINGHLTVLLENQLYQSKSSFYLRII